MSEQSGSRGKGGRRVLPVVDRSLMAEVLPDPSHARSLRAGPRERVLKRLLQLSERAAAIAAAASLSSACGADPGADNDGGVAGSNAGSGGSGGSGGITAGAGAGGASGMNVSMSGGGGGGGYMVVDPMPSPFVICPMPEATWYEALRAAWVDQLGIVVSIQLVQTVERGVTLNAISLESATVNRVVPIEIRETTGTAAVRLWKPSGDWPQAVELYMTFRCDGQDGTDHYELAIRLFTDMPMTSGVVRFELIEDDADAGS